MELKQASDLLKIYIDDELSRIKNTNDDVTDYIDLYLVNLYDSIMDIIEQKVSINDKSAVQLISNK